MPPEQTFEQLGVAAIIVVLLLWGLKIAIAKIDKLDIVIAARDVYIQGLHESKTEILISTLDAQNRSINTLDKAMEFINRENP